MATNPFALQIEQWMEKAKGRINQVVRKTAFDLGTEIIMKTPVKTGRARRNWMTSRGAPNTVTTDETDQSGTSTSMMIASELADYDYESGDSIFITNSLPYIVPLENGHSKQAPSGMVRITIAEFQNIVEGAGHSS